MFNKKLKLENEKLKKEIEGQEIIIEKLRQDLALPLPKDCKKGDYCSACVYGKENKVGHIWDIRAISSHYVCTKDCCKEFVKRENN